MVDARGTAMDQPAEVAIDLAEPRWQWLGAATGTVAVVLFVISFALAGAGPKTSDSVQKIVAYNVDHRARLLTSSYLGMLGLAFFIWFVGTLRGALSRIPDVSAELSGILFGAGMVVTTMVMVQLSLAAALAYRLPNDYAGSTVRAVHDITVILNVVVGFPAAVFLIAGGLLALRRNIGASWLGTSGLAIGIFEVFGAAAYRNFDGIMSPTGALTILGFVLFIAWVLAASIWLTVRLRTPAGRTSLG